RGVGRNRAVLLEAAGRDLHPRPRRRPHSDDVLGAADLQLQVIFRQDVSFAFVHRPLFRRTCLDIVLILFSIRFGQEAARKKSRGGWNPGLAAPILALIPRGGLATVPQTPGIAPWRSSAMPDDVRRPIIDKSRLPSRHVTVGPERAPHRAFLYSMGLTTEQINQPIIGVATTWNEAAPCNIALSR